MKYTQLIGVIAAFAVIAACYFPWTYIESKHLVISGMAAPDTNFGRPGLMNVMVSAISIFLFAVPRIWAKRTNLFTTIFNLAWSIRNFILLASCLMGECPVKKPALYLLVFFSFIMVVMALLPKLAVKPRG
jgi:hypothetical protein